MALVFLASSFEEFFRQEIMQCATSFGKYYEGVSDSIKISARNSYWNVCFDRIRQIKLVSVIDKKHRIMDPDGVLEARAIIETIRGYALFDDVSVLDSKYVALHSHNFRPNVLNELGNRLGIQDIVSRAADHVLVKRYFAESNKSITVKKLKLKLDGFYKVRNEIVHSLNASSGYGIDVVFDYIELFECFADGLRAAMDRQIATWMTPSSGATG